MTAPPVRRADFLMALAYATDLATGHSRDFALRSCVLAMLFADVAGLDEGMRRKIYHQALLRYIGCNADTHLLAAASAGTGYTAIETKGNFSRQIISAKAQLFGPCGKMPPHGATTVLAVGRDE